jgi:hypothetical protein
MSLGCHVGSAKRILDAQPHRLEDRYLVRVAVSRTHAGDDLTQLARHVIGIDCALFYRQQNIARLGACRGMVIHDHPAAAHGSRV